MGQMGHRSRNAERLAGNDERHGHKDQKDPDQDARRELLAEDQHTEKERRDRLQGAENGRRRGADAADGTGHRDQ